MQSLKDQTGNSVRLLQPPQRIVSLVPSQTELLFDLGLEQAIVGITKFCIHPADRVKSVPKIGGTKNFDLACIRALRPDLIIGNKEENYREGIETLRAEFPVWLSDIYTLDDALHMIHTVGALTDKATEANNLANTIDNSFAELSIFRQSILTAAYFIWRKPYMVAAGNTFIDDMLQKAGFVNVFNDLTRYPEITAEQLYSAQPDVIFLSSEPYPFRQKHVAEIQKICPKSKILLVNGELFSWYGSRLLNSTAYFLKLRKELSKFFIS
ncbi:MAG: helical backbone metal receptor [Spirosomataceae bacterium]